MSTNAATPSSLEQQALVFYTSIKAKIIKRHGSPFVQDIPGKKGFSMQWFTKKGGRAVVNVIVREAYGGLRIEFTRNLVSGISDEVVHAEKPALDVQLNFPLHSSGCFARSKRIYCVITHVHNLSIQLNLNGSDAAVYMLR